MDRNNRKKRSIPNLSASEVKDETIAEKFFSFFGCGAKTKKDESKNNNQGNFR